ncbi:MAG: adenosine-specific kinase [Deltaproteobacteria bacterium]|nr:MAG: adenosine-specific kinase [Deltaproteobacteria bacterium]
MEIKTVKLEIPEGANIILGQSHFIKTVEDLYEVMVTGVPGSKFGLAFCEASGHCLIRSEGNDPDLVEVAQNNAAEVAAGHTFIVVMKDGFPINVLNAIKMCQEVCTIYCATANPVEVIIGQTDQGRGILGVIDGVPPTGIEDEEGVKGRKKLLRDFGYKL